MDNNLTISALTFALSFNGESGSKRTETSRGPSLPEVLTVRHQTYVDSKTKLTGVRTAVRLDRSHELADGTIAPLSCTVVVAGPTDTGIVSADYDAVVDRMFNLLCGTTNTNGLDLKNEIFVNKQQ